MTKRWLLVPFLALALLPLSAGTSSAQVFLNRGFGYGLYPRYGGYGYGFGLTGGYGAYGTLAGVNPYSAYGSGGYGQYGTGYGYGYRPFG